MKRKILAAALLLLLLFSGTSLAQGDIRLWIYGDYIESDVAPYIKNDRTMVPLRVISEELDKDVIWVPEYRSIVIGNTYNDFEDAVIFRIGDRNLYHADGYIMAKLDAPPEIRGDRTFVPLRAVAEALQMEIGWDGAHRTVYIGSDYRPPKYDRRQMHLRIEGKDYPIPVQYYGNIPYADAKAVSEALHMPISTEPGLHGYDSVTIFKQPSGRTIAFNILNCQTSDGLVFGELDSFPYMTLAGRIYIPLPALADALHMHYTEKNTEGIFVLEPDMQNEEFPIYFREYTDGPDYRTVPARNLKIRYQNGQYELIGLNGFRTIGEFHDAVYGDGYGNSEIDPDTLTGEAALLYENNYYHLDREKDVVEGFTAN